MGDQVSGATDFGEMRVRRMPSPGIAAVLEVILLGHV
jgi:hypothetical protein